MPPRSPELSIVITGATDGIGLELARLYGSRGHRLVLVGRQPPENLSDNLFQTAVYCRVDLREETAADELCHTLEGEGIEKIDVLIHNAGAGYYGPVEEQSGVSIQEVLAVNLRTPVALTQALLPRLRSMSQNPRSKVVFISSIAASLPSPEFAVYAASKAALDGFARSLAIEQRGAIEVQRLSPGPTRTGMHAKVGVPAEATAGFPSAASTARRIAASIDRGRSGAVGGRNRLLGAVGRHFGAPLDAFMRWRSRR